MMDALVSHVRWKRILTWLGSVACLSVVLVVLLGCADSSSSRVTAAEATEEYLHEIQRLEDQAFELAPGDQWPDDPPFEETAADGVDVYYGKGAGAQWAQLRWFASWEHLAATTDDAVTRDHAVQELTRLTETTSYANMIPETRAHFDKTIEDAVAGDMTMLREDVAANPLVR
jgi:hypothetical protein